MTNRNVSAAEEGLWKHSIWVWLSLLLVIPLVAYIYYFGIDKLVLNWTKKEEYSHGLFIPFLSLFLVWQRKDEISKIPTQTTWGGVVLVAVSIAVYFLGEISAITVITQFALIITLAGLFLSVVGWKIFKIVWVAFFFLLLAVPVPPVIYLQISQSAQLISSELGVAFIRIFDISVFLEGNVIDLGTMKLQVVEACSGLRYLFPLMALAFISAYFYRDKLWKKILIFISSVPIAILVNSLRIGIIGVTVEYWGIEAAEGFLHDFEGWFMFMACMLVLIGEMWLLTNIGGGNSSLAKTFAIDVPVLAGAGSEIKTRRVSLSYGLSVLLLVMAAVSATFVEGRVETRPERQEFAYFPNEIAGWKGRPDVLDSIIQEQLDFDDYIISNYENENSNIISLYIAYYGEQRKGASIHSPRACLPGGGWEINSIDDHEVEGVVPGVNPLLVNRVVIKKGDLIQLVYYWFKQRHRNETSEFSIKWWLFWDALTRNRTDGALIRLTTFLDHGEEIADADNRLTQFTQAIYPSISGYVPD